MLVTFLRWIRRWISIWRLWKMRFKTLASRVKRVHQWICCRCRHSWVRGWKPTLQRLIRLSQVFDGCNAGIWITDSYSLSNSFAVIKKIFARNVENVIKQEAEVSMTKIMMAHRDLDAAVTVAVALKRKAYLYGSFAYGAPPDKGIINIFFDYGKLQQETFSLCLELINRVCIKIIVR